MSEDDLIQKIKRARAEYDKGEAARIKLFALIREGLADGMGPSALARASGFTREYIAKIRDGKTKT